MGIYRTLMVAGGLVGLMACAGPEVRYDYDVKADFAAYKTFDWQAAPGKVAGKAGEFSNPIMSARVRRELLAALEAKGFRRSDGADPDFLVSCYPVRQGGRSHQLHLGLGLGLGPIGVGVGAPVGDRSVEAVGSLVLEFQDFRSRLVVWKATAVKVLVSSDSPTEADEAVKDAVTGMLKHFPPPGK